MISFIGTCFIASTIRTTLGKRLVDNLEIIRRLREFKSLGYPILIEIFKSARPGSDVEDSPGLEKKEV